LLVLVFSARVFQDPSGLTKLRSFGAFGCREGLFGHTDALVPRARDQYLAHSHRARSIKRSQKRPYLGLARKITLRHGCLLRETRDDLGMGPQFRKVWATKSFFGPDTKITCSKWIHRRGNHNSNIEYCGDAIKCETHVTVIPSGLGVEKGLHLINKLLHGLQRPFADPSVDDTRNELRKFVACAT
jgi:hypothetical protein